MSEVRRSYATQFSISRTEPTRKARTDNQQKAQPLRESVRESIDEFFAHMGDHQCRGLYEMVIAEVEAPLLEAVMTHTKGNQSNAAEILGMNRGTLRKKLREYKLV